MVDIQLSWLKTTAVYMSSCGWFGFHQTTELVVQNRHLVSEYLIGHQIIIWILVYYFRYSQFFNVDVTEKGVYRNKFKLLDLKVFKLLGYDIWIFTVFSTFCKIHKWIIWNVLQTICWKLWLSANLNRNHNHITVLMVVIYSEKIHY